MIFTTGNRTFMSFTCEIKKQQAHPALVIRARTSLQNLPKTIGEGYGRIMGYLAGIGEQPAGAPFVAYYNMDMENLDIELGFPVAKKLPGRDSISASEIPGGMAATCLYTGPYQDMPQAYEALMKLVKEKGLEVSGVSYETYLNDPMVTPRQELMTLIMFPIKNK
jgi:effector-binding domain-containing protein